jgi:glycerate 2-kinase
LEGCPIVSFRERIPTRPLVVAGSFGGALRASATLPAASVAAAIAHGLAQGGWPAPDVCAILGAEDALGDVRAFLDAQDLDARLRRARALIIATSRLDARTLTGSAAFEVATRARQSGVPAYAVTGANLLDRFDARMLDLQAILEANGTRALTAAGRKLAQIL